MPTMTHPVPQPAPSSARVTGGVDTHKDTHTAAVLDAAGRLLGHRQFPTTSAGYALLLTWLRSHGELDKVGIEGTGAYGAGLAKHLQLAGVTLVEIDRPDRKTRRWQGKSDPVDAEAAARAAQAGRATGVPKDRTGRVEALRALRVARRSAVTARADTQTQMKSLIVTAPDQLRAQLRTLGDRQLIHHCATRRPDHTTAADPSTATVIALRALARRHQQLSVEIDQLDQLIAPLVEAINPPCAPCTASAPTSPASCWSPPGTTHNDSGQKRRSRCSAGPRHCPPPPGAPPGTGSTAAETARPTPRCTASCCAGCAGTPAPAPTPPGAPPRA